MTIECFGTWGDCSIQIPDGIVEDVFYWKISCLKRNECYLEWKKIGKQIGDIKLLE